MLDTFYDEEVKRILGSFDFPKGLIIDVVEYEQYLALRLYRDNFERFDGVDKEFIAKQIGGALQKVRAKGCPIYLEVERSVPDGRGKHPLS